MKRFLILSAILIFLTGSKRKEEEFLLFYTKNFPGDNWNNHRTGLLWALSCLGASLPEGSLDKAVAWKDSSVFSLDVKAIGFSQSALEALQLLIDSVKHSSSYRKNNCADLGGFISVTIGSSWHYYKITGVPATLSEFKALHPAIEEKVFPVTKSTVASHHRIIRYPFAGSRPADLYFIAEESQKGIGEKNYLPEIYEVFDVMPNGQLRFAVYDHNGDLIPASPESHGVAGKPAKCLWCHETGIQPLFAPNDSTPGFVTPREFQNDVRDLNGMLRQYRMTLKSDLDFSKTQDHTQMELAYISYMQPSVSRLAQEWKMGEAEVNRLIAHLRRTEHHEFKFLGHLVRRCEISMDCLFPNSVREPDGKEINFFSSE